MPEVKKLLKQLTCRCLRGTLPEEITQIAYDSRNVKPGAMFVCICGYRQDGHAFIKEAIERGAVVILAEAKGENGKTRHWKEAVWNMAEEKAVCLLETPDTRVALAALSAEWFAQPQQKLRIIGVTGTKGKTTTAWMIREMLEQSGHSTGLIGTIEIRYGDQVRKCENTTPESYELYEILRQMVEAGCKYVVMEVSSQALKQHRVDGIVFDTAVFTNLRPDHIGAGEHADLQEYISCKHLLFCRCRRGVFNQDDPYWQDMWRGSSCEQVITYGFSGQADYCADQVQLLRGSDRLAVQYHLTRHQEKRGQGEMKAAENKWKVVVNAPGKFSVYNSLAAIAVAEQYQVSEEVIDNVLHTLQVPGRIEMLPVSPRFIVIVDYAHNAMALQALLTTLQDYHPGRVICIFGCGGNRSAERRYQMGEAAGRLADLVVVTTDNPREEDPEKIAEEIGAGIHAAKADYAQIPDREQAIAYGISHAKPGDIVVIAGKGHEDYQEIGGKKYPMDDRELAMKCKVW